MSSYSRSNRHGTCDYSGHHRSRAGRSRGDDEDLASRTSHADLDDRVPFSLSHWNEVSPGSSVSVAHLSSRQRSSSPARGSGNYVSGSGRSTSYNDPVYMTESSSRSDRRPLGTGPVAARPPRGAASLSPLPSSSRHGSGYRPRSPSSSRYVPSVSMSSSSMSYNTHGDPRKNSVEYRQSHDAYISNSTSADGSYALAQRSGKLRPPPSLDDLGFHTPNAQTHQMPTSSHTRNTIRVLPVLSSDGGRSGLMVEKTRTMVFVKKEETFIPQQDLDRRGGDSSRIGGSSRTSSSYERSYSRDNASRSGGRINRIGELDEDYDNATIVPARGTHSNYDSHAGSSSSRMSHSRSTRSPSVGGHGRSYSGSYGGSHRSPEDGPFSYKGSYSGR